MANKYEEELIDSAQKLDSQMNIDGVFYNYSVDVVKNNNENAILGICKKISSIVANNKSQETLQLTMLLKNKLLSYCGYVRLKEVCSGGFSPAKDEDKTYTLAELQQELDGLVGLTFVKNKVNDLIAFQKIQQLRKAQGLASSKSTMHMAFTGNPGTGKTTVARIVGRMYKSLGLLSKGQFIEVSRTDLIAGYQGQTALKVKKVIERAKGGVLFVDEAYSITENEHSDSYGRECLTELTKALEDYRNDLVVIVAGYTEPMKIFFESNPGLKSRFNTFIEFPDYTAFELMEILYNMCLKNDYMLTPTAKEKLQDILIAKVAYKNDEFANGRLVRNIYDDIIMNQARRLINVDNPTKGELMQILDEDVSY
ncbi:AAA family ATPase [Phascolarctobacterium succinatutens]|uniref:AAA family ATPase n=6 Tax=Phascolarctobacterium succinatutens TaxID=626940 RepID=UPI0023F05DC7|nr:AAA family ATPase [Phascolarctobacterium succinatutens]